MKLASEKRKAYINPEEAELVERIFNKYLELESIRGVAKWLNSEGYKTRNHADWSTITVSRILRNPVYIGKVCYNKRISSKGSGRFRMRPKEAWIISEGQHESIIDEEVFNKVQSLLKKQKRKPRRKLSEYLLSGKVW